MLDDVVEDMIVVIAVVLIGLVIASFAFSYFIPKISFSNAQSLANSMASSMSISNGPLLISGSQGSVLVEAYNPSYNYTYTIVAFVVPSTYESSVGLVTPQTPTTTSSFKVVCSDGNDASSVNLGTVYSLSGTILVTSGVGYTVKANTPFTIDVNNVNSNDIVVVWVLYQDSGYTFRTDYVYSGVPT